MFANMDEKIVLYMHAGSGNHGCEAIVNGLCSMIKEKAVLISYRAGEDEKYSLKELCEIIQERSFDEHKLAHVLYYLYRKLTKDAESFIRYRYREIFGEKKSLLAVSIGGDNYCYESMLQDLRLTNSAFDKAGIPTVLFGCSIEPELLSRKEIRKDLAGYHTIIARESVTFDALKGAFDKENEGTLGQEILGQEILEQDGRKPRILYYPDPAFTLKAKELPLPDGFAEGNTVGINVSPMIQDNEKTAGITMECYSELIRCIIESTDMQIALIPHVVWGNNDDRKPLHELYERFKESGRVVEIGDASCEELKGYIGRCRLFVGARTHATIAAYSSCVPTLVVGYSVKAKGIARDLFGTEEHYVISVQSLKQKEDLVKGFWWLMDNQKVIRDRLTEKMPAYQQQALMAGKEVDRLWEEFSRQQEI